MLSTTDALNPIGVINPDAATPATNGTSRISSIAVVKSSTFDVTMNTNAVTLTDSSLGSFRDYWADGYRAMVKLDEGVDFNGSGQVDFRNSASSQATVYGFENFTTVNDPGYDANPALSGNGTYKQTINTSLLSEGYHYLTVRVWRSPRAGEAEVYQDFRKTIYVDRFAPESTIDSVGQMPYQSASTLRDVRIKSTDGTADSVHVLFDVPVNLSDAQVLSLVAPGNKADAIDAGLFGKATSNVGSGLHTVVSVTYEPTGRYKVHRFANIPIGTTRGLGMGDVNYDGGYSQSDVNTFETALYSNVTTTTSSQFIASGDMNGNGVMDTNDLFLLPGRYASVFNSAGYVEALAAIQRRGDVNRNSVTNVGDIDALLNKLNTSDWYADLNADGTVNGLDEDRLILQVMNTQYGDTNLDGRIDLIDLNNLSAAFGQSNASLSWSNGELNGDDLVDLQDFFAPSANWGYGVSGGLAPMSVELGGMTFTVGTVPEPVSAVSFVVLGCLTLRRHR
ncbi:MAG: hypothetical protein QM770_08715 [Tepidisphaeraceae bacterium]